MSFVIAIAQQKGGAGKSTVAASLAVALAASGLRVALLDTDPQATLSRWWALRKGTAAGGEAHLRSAVRLARHRRHRPVAARP